MNKNTVKKLSALCIACLIGLNGGCSSGSAAPNETAAPGEDGSAVGQISYNPVTVKYEAEDAALTGKARVEKSMKGFSGSGYVTGFENDGDSCEFTINIEEEGFYDLNFISSTGSGGYKENYVYINGINTGTVAVDNNAFGDSVLKRIYFEKGETEVSYVKYWGWAFLDRLEITNSEPLNTEIYNIEPKLINPVASDQAKRLMKYLTDIYGEYILTGQYCDLGLNGHEMFTVQRETGKKPAVLGLDLMEYTPSRAANGSEGKTAERAVEFWDAGGIVTMCWHWNAPEDYLTGNWYSGFYTDSTNISLEKIMNGQDEKGYELLIRDIDAIAEPLKKIQEANVPILWRPLHEASGGWFWWGASGPEPYKQLWKLVYGRLTDHHGLNNLIWVWNGQDAEWYPGGEFADIVGEDIYAGERVYSPQTGKFMEILEYTGGEKMIVLSENGTLFDPDLAVRDGAMWGFFAVWSGEFTLVGNGFNMYSEKYSEKSMLKKVYAHEKTLTLDELPDLKTY